MRRVQIRSLKERVVNYTKGEWKIVPMPEMNSNRIMSYSPEYFREVIADVFGLNGSDAANAQLIAAAPDMYEAAKVALHWLDGVRKGDTVMADFLRQAIAKAEGRTP